MATPTSSQRAASAPPEVHSRSSETATDRGNQKTSQWPGDCGKLSYDTWHYIAINYLTPRDVHTLRATCKAYYHILYEPLADTLIRDDVRVFNAYNKMLLPPDQVRRLASLYLAKRGSKSPKEACDEVVSVLREYLDSGSMRGEGLKFAINQMTMAMRAIRRSALQYMDFGELLQPLLRGRGANFTRELEDIFKATELFMDSIPVVTHTTATITTVIKGLAAAAADQMELVDDMSTAGRDMHAPSVSRLPWRRRPAGGSYQVRLADRLDDAIPAPPAELLRYDVELSDDAATFAVVSTLDNLDEETMGEYTNVFQTLQGILDNIGSRRMERFLVKKKRQDRVMEVHKHFEGKYMEITIGPPTAHIARAWRDVKARCKMGKVLENTAREAGIRDLVHNHLQHALALTDVNMEVIKLCVPVKSRGVSEATRCETGNIVHILANDEPDWADLLFSSRDGPGDTVDYAGCNLAAKARTVTGLRQLLRRGADLNRDPMKVGGYLTMLLCNWAKPVGTNHNVTPTEVHKLLREAMWHCRDSPELIRRLLEGLEPNEIGPCHLLMDDRFPDSIRKNIFKLMARHRVNFNTSIRQRAINRHLGAFGRHLRDADGQSILGISCKRAALLARRLDLKRLKRVRDEQTILIDGGADPGYKGGAKETPEEIIEKLRQTQTIQRLGDWAEVRDMVSVLDGMAGKMRTVPTTSTIGAAGGGPGPE